MYYLTIENSDHLLLMVDLTETGIANTPGAQLVSELEDMNCTFIRKYQYSAFFGSQLDLYVTKLPLCDSLHFFIYLFFDTSQLYPICYDLSRSALKAEEVTTVILAGIQTDFCIFATALDAFNYGFKVLIAQVREQKRERFFLFLVIS